MHTPVVFAKFLLFYSGIIFDVCFGPTSSEILNFITLFISNSKVLTHQKIKIKNEFI